MSVALGTSDVSSTTWLETLSPVPQRVIREEGDLSLVSHLTLAGHGASNVRTAFRDLAIALRQIQPDLAEFWEDAESSPFQITLGKHGGGAGLADDVQAPWEAESYALRITSEGLILKAGDANGLYHGTMRLLQLLEKSHGHLPCVTMYDAPDLSWRGYGCFYGGHSYQQNPDNIPRYHALVDCMSRTHMNRLAFESEEFADDDALAEFGRYCRAHHVEPVPVHPFLCMNHHDIVALVKASEEAFTERMKPFERAYRLLKPQWFCIAGDELVDGYDVASRGSIYSQAELSEHRPHEWFAMAVNRLHDWIVSKGVRMCMWADGLLDPLTFRGLDMETKDMCGGAPDYHGLAIDSLPRDILLWDWQYTATRAYGTLDYLVEQGFQVIGGSLMGQASERLYPEYGVSLGHSENFLGMMSMTWCQGDVSEVCQPHDLAMCGDAFWTVGRYVKPLPAADVFRVCSRERNPLCDLPAGLSVIRIEGPGERFALLSSGRLYCWLQPEGFGGWHPGMRLTSDIWYEVRLMPGLQVERAHLDLEFNGKARCRIGVAADARAPWDEFAMVGDIPKGAEAGHVELSEAVCGRHAFCFWLRITDNEDYHFIRSMTVTVNSVPAT